MCGSGRERAPRRGVAGDKSDPGEARTSRLPYGFRAIARRRREAGYDIRVRGKWLLLAGFAVIGGVGIGALSHRMRKAPPPAPAGAATIANANSNEITVTATIRAQHITNVGATIEGNIEAFVADVGDAVFEGQVLARIGSAGLETSHEQASAAVER